MCWWTFHGPQMMHRSNSGCVQTCCISTDQRKTKAFRAQRGTQTKNKADLLCFLCLMWDNNKWIASEYKSQQSQFALYMCLILFWVCSGCFAVRNTAHVCAQIRNLCRREKASDSDRDTSSGSVVDALCVLFVQTFRLYKVRRGWTWNQIKHVARQEMGVLGTGLVKPDLPETIFFIS